MGQSAAETLKEIEQARVQLEEDLGELGERMPDPRKVKRAFRFAAIGFALMMVAKIVRRFKKRD